MAFLAAIAGAKKGLDIAGSIFGKRSSYTFNPYKPPGAFRGKERYEEWLKQRAAYFARQGGGGPMIAAPTTPGELSKTSPVMPGGAVVGGSSGGAINTGRRRKRRRARARSRTRTRRRGGRRGLSQAQLRAGFGGRGRMRRRRRR